MKLRARPLLKNPIKRKTKRAKRGHAEKRYVIEALQVHGRTSTWRSGLRFLYWDGKKLVASTHRARHYMSREDARRAAKEAIKKQPASIRLLRVVRV